MEQDFVYGELPEEKLRINPKELAARLQTDRGYTNALMEQCEAELRRVLACRYTARHVSVACDGDEIDLGFATVKSHSLSRNLKGCKEAFVFALTLGMGVERLLNRLSLLSESEFFITDALASAMAEAACDCVEAELKKGGLAFRPRFSPGYGDLSLELQPNLLRFLEGQKLLGVTLNPSLLMTPMKSITAIMGVCHEEDM